MGYLIRGIFVLCGLLLAGCDVSSGGGSSDEQQPDPVVVDYPIAYVARPLPLDANGNLVSHNILEPAAFHPGARLMLKPRAQASAPETAITAGVFTAPEGQRPLYDVKDLAVSSDGKKLLFAMRAPAIENADEDEQPTWNIWEYHTATDTLRRIIESDITAEQGQDVAPAYLPDGRIVFSSTRQRRSRAILLDEGKPQYAGLTEDRQQAAFVLHVMDSDGQNIQQITFNQSHDLQPTVLSDGRIAFLRWDNAGRRDRLSLYTVNPDGSGLALLYGYHSQNTGTNATEATFTHPQQMPDGRLLITLRPRESLHWGGDIVAINTAGFIDNHQPTAANTGADGPAQQSRAVLPVLLDGQLSLHGYFNGATPLFDGTGRMLVSWSQCRVLDPATGQLTFCTAELPSTAQEADPLYSLWIYDPLQQTQLPVVVATEGTLYTDPAVLAPQPLAAHIPATPCDMDCEAAGTGVVHIRSVYDFDGVDLAPGGIAATADPLRTPPEQRPARFLRIVKPVSIPDDDVLDFDNSAFGVSASQSMREIVGYVPIEPDGSVKFRVPADIAFSLAVVDAQGRRIGGRHQNWLTVQAGEVRECNGCHTAASERPHGRPDAVFESINPGALASVPFLNTQLVDSFGTPQPPPNIGETMAEYYSRLHGPRIPTLAIAFEDEWTDPGVTAKAASFALTYAQICASHGIAPEDCQPRATDPLVWTPPTANCGGSNWIRCRSVIHYPLHIQPLWEVSRPVFDGMGNQIDDHQCIRCHSERDAMGTLRVPPGQLLLTQTSTFSPNNDFMVSYVELLRTDNEQVLDGGQLLDKQMETGEYQTDENGELILDANGNPIPILTTVPVPAAMSTNGARASNDFFAKFATGGTHESWLTPAELKLIAEWLDIGGQYYNDPFAAPAN